MSPTAYQVWFGANREDIQKHVGGNDFKNVSWAALSRKGMELWDTLPDPPLGLKNAEVTAPVKEPLTAYSAWFNEHRQGIQKQLCSKGLKNLSGKALARKGLELWNALPAMEKKPYEEKYATETKACESISQSYMVVASQEDDGDELDERKEDQEGEEEEVLEGEETDEEEAHDAKAVATHTALRKRCKRPLKLGTREKGAEGGAVAKAKRARTLGLAGA